MRIGRLVVLLLLLVGWGGAGFRPAAAQALKGAPWQPDALLNALLIKQMVTDSVGFRWIASSEGVFRYDGYDLVPLAQLVRAGSVPPPRTAKQVVRGPAGCLWFGGESGLFCFTPRTGRLQEVKLAEGQAKKIDALFRHPRSGHLWVGYENTILVLDSRWPHRVLSPPRRVAGTPYYLQADGSAAGVWISFQQPNWPIPRLYTDTTPPGAVQIGLTGPPLRRLTTNCFVVPVPATDPLLVFSASALFTLTDGQLREKHRWLPAGNEDNFVCAAQTDTLREWVSQGHRLRLTVRGPRAGHLTIDTLRLGTSATDHRHSYALEVDPFGIQWCYSQFWRGVYKQRAPRPRVVQPLLLATGRPAPSTRAIVRLPDGRLLLGAYGGPLVQAADSPTAPLRPLAVTQNGVARLPLGYDLLVTRKGEVIFSEDGRGISQLDPATGQLDALPFTAAETAVPTHCSALLEGRNGRMWAATSSGLFEVQPQLRRVVRYATGPAARQLARHDIIDLAEDPQTGALWLATADGLYLLAPASGTMRRVGGPNAPRPLPAQALLCVADAGPGRAWVGTATSGLLLVEAAAGLVRQVSVAEGLPSQTIATVVPQPDGTVWAGTYAGLIRYDPATERLAVLTEADGLLDAELNRNSAYADPTTGALWFGGVGGLHRVGPHASAAPAAARYAPTQLLLTTLTEPAGGQAANTAAAQRRLTGYQLPHLRLAPGDDAFVELRLALTNLFSPELTRYAYRLRRPGDTQRLPWLPTTRRLILRGLPAGAYTVEVRAETATGQPAANTVRVPLHVAQIWWRHPVAWGAGAALLVLLGYGLFWLQGRRGRREARLREELAANLHDEVGTLLAKISLMAEVLQHQSAPAAPPPLPANAATADLLGRLLRSSRDAVQAMRDVVWSIDSRADSVPALLDRMQDYLDETAGSAGLDYTFTADPIARLQRLRPVVRKQLYLVFKEAVTNALRHGRGATLLHVRIVREAATFVLEVTDNGPPVSGPGRSGLGLRNMKARAHELSGSLETGARPDGHPGYHVLLRIKA